MAAFMVGLDDELVSRTDDLLEDHLADGGTLVASTADASVFHPGGLGTAALILPLPAGTASFTIDAPFALDLDLQAFGAGGRRRQRQRDDELTHPQPP